MLTTDSDALRLMEERLESSAAAVEAARIELAEASGRRERAAADEARFAELRKRGLKLSKRHHAALAELNAALVKVRDAIVTFDAVNGEVADLREEATEAYDFPGKLSEYQAEVHRTLADPNGRVIGPDEYSRAIDDMKRGARDAADAVIPAVDRDGALHEAIEAVGIAELKPQDSPPLVPSGSAGPTTTWRLNGAVIDPDTALEIASRDSEARVSNETPGSE